MPVWVTADPPALAGRIGLDWPVSGFTQAEIELLGRLIRTIRRLYAESAYGGGDI